jgi:neutral amino acid transport system ATP-binding protein
VVLPPGAPSSPRQVLSEDTSSVLEVRDASCSYGGALVVDGVSMCVSEASITGLIGPNGAGKSSLLNVISGFMAPRSGSIWFRGKELTGQPAYTVARLGVIRTFQLTNLFPRLTVLENLLLGALRGEHETLLSAFVRRQRWRTRERASIERARALLDDFGLLSFQDRYGDELSGGQKRIVEILRALMGSPTVLLLDEPFAGLSPAIVDQMEEYLRGASGSGLAILLVEHELKVVSELCDTVVVMAEGRVLAQGEMADLRQNEEVRSAYLN